MRKQTNNFQLEALKIICKYVQYVLVELFLKMGDLNREYYLRSIFIRQNRLNWIQPVHKQLNGGLEKDTTDTASGQTPKLAWTVPKLQYAKLKCLEALNEIYCF